MPIFLCESCGRLLFRPEELLGSAWQCPTCGPTVICTEEVTVSLKLASLLQKEYELGLREPPVIYPRVAAGSQTAAYVQVNTGQTGMNRFAAVVFFCVCVTVLLSMGSMHLPRPYRNYCTAATPVAVMGLLGLGLVMMLGYGYFEMRRRSALRRIGNHQWTAFPRAPSVLPDARHGLQQHVEVRDSAVRPAAGTEDWTMIKQREEEEP